MPHDASPNRRTIPFRHSPACTLAGLAGCALLIAGCDNLTSARNGAGAPFGLGVPGAAPAFSNEDAAQEQSDALARDIEEADIVKQSGNLLLALNRYKGLLIVDVTDPDKPALVGELDLRGRGVEMYAVGAQAYVLLSADIYYHAAPFAGGATPAALTVAPPLPPPDFDGSQLAIVDIADPSAPALLGKISMAGFANESRRVGDVLYVAGANIVPAGAADDGINGAAGFLASINIADPADIQPVAREVFSGAATGMYVSQTHAFAASDHYDEISGQSFTRVQMVDISDPAGAITLLASFDVPGVVRNRFYMDEFGGAFRVVTESRGFGFRQVRLFTFDLADPDDVVPLGETSIIEGESLEAVRFDGVRGYVVTFLRVDPLFVVDLSDPANPAVTGELEVPGFSTHIEPRGERLIAVGIDDTDGRRPAVSYYDVSDPATPTELGRIILGPPGSFTTSDAVYDEKAFKIVDEIGLIAIPFRHVDYSRPVGDGRNTFASDAAARPLCMNGVQLVDFDDDALTQRGWFEHEGKVMRVGMAGERLFALSVAGLATVDISDRDQPAPMGKAAFFDADEMDGFVSDCGGFMPIDPGFEPNVRPVLIEIFLDGEMCGTISAVPAAMLVGGLGFVGRRRRR